MKLVAIVLNYMSFEDSAACAQHLATIADISAIVIVDNASPNDSWEKLTEIFTNVDKVHVLRTSHNGGYGYGNNFGAKYAFKELHANQLLIINPDAKIEADAVHAVSSILSAHDRYGALAPKVIDSSGITKTWAQVWNVRTFADNITNTFSVLKHFVKQSPLPAPNNLGIIEGDCISGACLFVNARLFIELNGYDEKMFLFGEESVLGKKIKDSAHFSGIVTTYTYEHSHSKTINSIYSLRKKMHLMNQSHISKQH